MGLIALLAYYAAQYLWHIRGTLGLSVHLGIAIAAGMAALLPLLRLFKVEEERELSGILVRLVGKLL